jgi:hypothetical protein
MGISKNPVQHEHFRLNPVKIKRAQKALLGLRPKPLSALLIWYLPNTKGISLLMQPANVSFVVVLKSATCVKNWEAKCARADRGFVIQSFT